MVACFIIAVIGLIQYSNHAKQVELEEYNAEMAEKHVRDSIEHEKAMQQQKEERKKEIIDLLLLHHLSLMLKL